MHDAIAEITEHHRFIESWLRGTAPSALLEEFLGMHTPDFTLCGPDGGTADRAGIATGFGAGRGAEPDITVQISDARVVVEDAGLVVATYEEHQAASSSTNARRTTAVFLRDPSARNGLRWKHLHETWIVPTAAW